MNIINLENLYFDSLVMLKYLPEWRIKDRNEYPNKILSIHMTDLRMIIFISLILINNHRGCIKIIT